MTIFDVLKYPISIPPTKEQLDRIPDEIWLTFDNSGGISLAKSLYNSQWNIPPLYPDEIKDINQLKKCITDWDTDDNI
jgi:hypothetical protein